jgi:NADH-quinone oxidoreductase subunit N
MDALIVIFLSGLLSLFVAFAKKPLYVLVTASVGLLTAAGLLLHQLFNLGHYLSSDVVNPHTLFSYQGLAFNDASTISYSLVAILFTFLSILAGYKSFKSEEEHTGDYIGLLLFSLTGALCMVSFTDMFMFFLGLEILSIPIYVLAGSKKKDTGSSEASLKYFLMGAFATGVLLFGIAWVYGATKSFDLNQIAMVINNGEGDTSLMYVGILLILAAFLFKVGAAPFHFWGPDVYDGSPSVITGFMASVVKLAAFGAFIKLFGTIFIGLHDFWAPALMVLAIITMFIGNLSAISQVKFKRLLAYSSITHVGYALLTILTEGNNNEMNLLFYLFSYGFSVLALITISMILEDKEDRLEAFKGLAKRNPILGFIAVLALLSLAGVPPLVGFFGKYLVFSSAFEQYPTLVIIAIANSGIGIYYYLKTVMTVISKEETTETPATLSITTLQWVVLAACAFGLIFGGCFVTYF